MLASYREREREREEESVIILNLFHIIIKVDLYMLFSVDRRHNNKNKLSIQSTLANYTKYELKFLLKKKREIFVT